MTHILIVEDEPDLADLIALYCDNAGWETTICHSAEEAMGALKVAEFSLVTLDINLPGMDGFSFLGRMKDSLSCPVIVVSAREADHEIIEGLEMGADEYVTKPFAPKVLIARIQALLRRANVVRPTDTAETYQFGKFLLEPESYTLLHGADRVQLSTREFDILTLLARAENTPLSAYDILDQVWGQQSAEASAVGVYIQRLRKKLAVHDEHSAINTVHGRGYALDCKRVT
jgi:two-component system response regulator RegX3